MKTQAPLCRRKDGNGRLFFMPDISHFFKGEKKVKALLCLLYYDKQREVQVDVCSSIQFCRYDLNFNFMMSAVYCLTMGKNLSSL